MILSLFKGVKAFIGIKDVKTASTIFRFFCSFTPAILGCFSIMVAANDFFGKPIHCMAIVKLPEAMLNNYCWQANTFTRPDPDTDLAIYPRVRPTFKGEGNGNRVYHAYYQWVCWVLAAQMMLFLLPRWIWSKWEGGLIESCTSGLRQTLPMNNEERYNKVRLLAEYFKKFENKNVSYLRGYFFCEFLCVFNLCCQIYLMHIFLGGEFLSYGWGVIALPFLGARKRDNPMDIIFPKMTQCVFHSYGRSGTLEQHGALCLMPQNVVNEKGFVVLWVWFFVLLCLSLVLIVYRFAMLLRPVKRYALTFTNGSLVDKAAWGQLCTKLTLADWWLVYQFGHNLDHVAFSEFVNELSESHSRKTYSDC